MKTSKRKDPNRNTCKHVLAPGFWIDESDNLHISAHDICVANGIEPTPENIEIAMEEAEKSIKKLFPKMDVLRSHTPED